MYVSILQAMGLEDYYICLQWYTIYVTYILFRHPIRIVGNEYRECIYNIANHDSISK